MNSTLKRCLKAAAILAFSALTGCVFCALAWLSGHKGLPAGSFPLLTAAVSSRLEMRLLFGAAFALCLLTVRAFLRGQPARHFSWWRLLLALFYAGTYLIGYALVHQKGPGIYLLLGGKPALGLIAADAVAVFYMLIELADRALDKIGEGPRAAEDAAAHRRSFLLACLVLALAWLPYVVICLPGTDTYDLREQLVQYMGLRPLSNDNPILDTMIFGVLNAIGGSGNGGCTVILLFQYALFVLAFAYCVQTVRRITGCPKAAWVLLAVFALNPIIGVALQYLVKDSLHLPFVVLLFSLLARVLFLGQLRKRDYVCYVLLFIIAALTRKAALTYVAAAGLLTSLLPRCRKTLLACTAGALALVLAFNYLLLPALGIRSAKQKATLPLFLQVIGYVTIHGSPTAEEAAEVERLLGTEKLRDAYDPNNSDRMKDNLLPDDTDSGQTAEIMRLGLRLARNHPKQAAMGVISAYWKYFFPQAPNLRGHRTVSTQSHADLLPVCSYVFPQANTRLDNTLRQLMYAPLLSWLFSPGTYTWLLGFVLMRVLRRRQTRLLPLVLPLLVLTAGLLLTPINGMTRYAYPIVAVAPFLTVLSALARDTGKPAAPAQQGDEV